MNMQERLDEIKKFACDVTDGVLDDEWYAAYKWMRDATAEIERLKIELEETERRLTSLATRPHHH